ncbi:uncharacterized protein LOC110027645 [Phalaenopsis equestris]|uniref:uncharacterized protein LOC110027645 n=1 Tax=Phalaenopsis equestris TaxID=78828 RepID=UPI0009E60A55|nr:uncharacterized protein LOC110027645 [Phalaenopsis equestris]
MGCTQSKIENEELVARCKERKQLMKSAVNSRNAMAAAQSAYTMALKNTGAALSEYAQGELHEFRAASNTLPSSSSAPAGQISIVSSSAAASIGNATSVVQPPRDNFLPPPPPPGHLPSVAPLQRAASMPGLPISKVRRKKFAHDSAINEEDDPEGTVDDSEMDGADDSSAAPATPPAPPAPPKPSETKPAPPPHQPTVGNWDILNHLFNTDHIPGPSLGQPEESTLDKEAEKFAKAESTPAAAVKDPTPPVPAMVIPEKGVAEPAPIQQQRTARKQRPSGGSSHHHRTGSAGGGSESRRGKTVPGNFLQILMELDEHFLKAFESANEVSKMLEATRLHYHSNFADNRGLIDHSAKVLKVITWNRSIKGIRSEVDAQDDLDDEKWETHATVLDKMLAWEKKLYDEVKAVELMKFEYQRKLHLLNKQKKHGVGSEYSEKLTAAVSQLHTRYIVDMQSMDSTVSEINNLRDHKLYPKLVELVNGMSRMWEAMHFHHSNQQKLVAALRDFEISHAPRETSEQHHETTIQLWQIVREWHSQFQNLITHQKQYIKSLKSWLDLNLIPIKSSLKENSSSTPPEIKPPIKDLIHAWHDQLEKLPDGFAKGAIISFSEVIKTIIILQEDELKLKERCEETRKEFFRKKRNFEDWHRKYVEKRAENKDGDDTNQKDMVEERKFAVESLEIRLKSEEETYQKTCKQVREKSAGTLKNKLPELFEVMSEFSLSCAEIYKQLRIITQPEKPTASG